MVNLYGILQTPIEGIADECVANRDLVYPRDALDEVLQVLGVEVVTRIET